MKRKFTNADVQEVLCRERFQTIPVCWLVKITRERASIPEEEEEEEVNGQHGKSFEISQNRSMIGYGL